MSVPLALSSVFETLLRHERRGRFGADTVNEIKLKCYEQMETSPSQMCLYFEGQLLRDDATLREAGVLAHSTLHLFIDETIEADTDAALEQLGAGGAKGKRAVEDGFVGCALLGGGCADASAGGSTPSEPMEIV